MQSNYENPPEDEVNLEEGKTIPNITSGKPVFHAILTLFLK